MEVSRKELARAARAWANCLECVDFGYTRMAYMSMIESVAHELAHAVLLGMFGRKCSRPKGADKISDRIRNVSQQEGGDEVVNQHEVRALALEVLALREFGIRISIRNLAEGASYYNRSNPYISKYRRYCQARMAMVDITVTRLVPRLVELLIEPLGGGSFWGRYLED